MKTKAKLTLAISALSAVVLAAGITSSYAWLTTQNTATLNTGTMTVSTVSSITVTVTKLGYDVTSSPKAGSAYGTATNYFEDSGNALGTVTSTNGFNFHAPKALRSGIGEDVYVAGDFAEVETTAQWTGKGEDQVGASNGYVGFVKYGIRVQAGVETGTPRELKYKFNITPTGTQITAAYRVAFLSSASGYASGTKIGYYAATAGSKTAGIAGGSSIACTVAPTSVTSFTTPVKTSSTVAIDQYYILSAWVDGNDAAAVNTNTTNISGQTLKVELEFSLN